MDIEKSDKPFVAVICGESETKKKQIADEIVNGRENEFFVFKNPESNCHPKIQSMSAERNARNIAESGRQTVLTTNSFHYLEAFLFYLQKYGAYGNVHFFLAENGSVYETDNAQGVMKNLSQPSFDLADERFAYELDKDEND